MTLYRVYVLFNIARLTVVVIVLLITSVPVSTRVTGSTPLFTVALWNRADHYIFILWFLSSVYLLLLFFPHLISAAAHWPHWMSTIVPHFHTWCGLSANLECISEMCCTRLAENAGRKKVAKNRHLGTIAQLCWAISSQLRHVSTIGKKLVKQQYVLPMSPQYGELRLTNGPTAEICSGVWGTPSNFNRFRVLAALLHGSQVVSVSQTLRR